jgi:hypothetical protein
VAGVPDFDVTGRFEKAELFGLGGVDLRWTCGSGCTAHAIRRALEPLARPMSPLTVPVKKRDTTRVEPAEITYLEIRNDGMVPQPSFKGLLRRR